MKKIKELNLIDNKKLLTKLNIWGTVLMVFFFIIFVGIAVIVRPAMGEWSNTAQFGLMQMFLIFVIYFILIIIHELIHGLFFKLFQPRKKVSFGFKNFMAYASSPGSKYSAPKYTIICLAPFVFISIGLTLIYIFSKMSIFDYALLASVHAASCIGDFYFFKIVLQSPKGAIFEDTATGLNVYQEK